MEGTQPKNNIDLKRVGVFVLITYALAWIPEFWYFSSGGTIRSGWFVVLALACMFTPAISAIIVQNVLADSPLSDIGLKFSFNKWLVIATVIPIIIALLSILFSVPLTEVELSNGIPFITDQINNTVEIPSSEKEIAIQTLEQLGGWLPLLLVGVSIIGAMIIGPTLNAIPALGEELGWRGLLYKELKPLGFWTSSVVIGIIWGFWHLPLIINGYNYPENPVGGIFMMVLFTVLLSPILTYLRDRANTVLVAAAFHGTLNAIAGLPILFFAGGSNLIIGVNGLAGAIVLMIANGIIFRIRIRKQ